VVVVPAPSGERFSEPLGDRHADETDQAPTTLPPHGVGVAEEQAPPSELPPPEPVEAALPLEPAVPPLDPNVAPDPFVLALELDAAGASAPPSDPPSFESDEHASKPTAGTRNIWARNPRFMSIPDGWRNVSSGADRTRSSFERAELRQKPVSMFHTK
jgi:hypothetical protein